MPIEKITPQAISNLVLAERKGDSVYDALQGTFARDIEQLKHEHSHPIAELLGPGKGPGAARKVLSDQNHGDWFPENAKDFSGIYVWYHKETPLYVGISRGVLRRLKQHLSGKSHFSASMAYKIARTLCNEYEGARGAFDPDCEKIGRVQEWLLEQRIAMLPISDPDHLALFVIYCSMKLDTVLNTFETH